MKKTNNTPRTKIRIPLYAALVLAIGLAACQPDHGAELREQALLAPPSQPNLIGTPFAQGVAGMIVRSDRIVITEHSDAFDGVSGKAPAKPVIVYAERELTGSQTGPFLEAVLSMDPSTHGAPLVGAFKARHTIYFYGKGQLLSKMDVCFECAQIRWNGGVDAPYPDAMIPTLKKMIRNFGMTTDRDWDKYALAHENKLNK